MADPIKASMEATKVEYRQLGKSGLKVSVPILGAMSYGDKRWMPWVLESEEALPLLKAAYDCGLNSWDTANLYSNGASEQVIAQALKKYQIPRDKVVIMTKCNGYVGETPDAAVFANGDIVHKTKDYVNHGGLSRSAIIKAVNKSLARLETDYIDLLQIHRFDAKTPIEETMETLHDLVRSGKVHYIGASSMWAYQFAAMQNVAEKHGWTKFVSMQNHYNLLYREEEREMNAYCNETGVGLIPWSPLCRGYLARPLDTQTARVDSEKQAQKLSRFAHFFELGKTDVDKETIGRVKELADRKGWTMSQVALSWINAKVTSPIVGLSSLERIDEAVGATGKILSEDDIKYLEELYIPRVIVGHS